MNNTRRGIAFVFRLAVSALKRSALRMKLADVRLWH